MNYVLKQTRPTISSHSSGRQPYVADVAGEADDDDQDLSKLLIEARLRSGDYFVTLATELEKLALLLEDRDISESADVERIASELIYLDKNYRITPK